MAQIKEEMTSDKIDITHLLVRSLRLCALCGSTVVLVTTVYLRIAKKPDTGCRTGSLFTKVNAELLVILKYL